MALFKRGNTWWIDFTTPAGKRVRQTAGTSDKTQAQELHDRLKAETWRVQKLGDRPNYLWDDAALRWLQEKTHLRGYEKRKYLIAWWHRHFKGIYLRDINRDVVSKALATAANRKDSSNRIYRDMLVTILNMAVKEWEWLDRLPRLSIIPTAPPRVRWLKPEEALRLLSFLPPEMQALMRFALATGLRKMNVVRLEWSQVETGRKACWIPAVRAKAGKDIHVVLNATALAVLEGQRGKHPRFVFPNKAGTDGAFSKTAWFSALAQAGIENFHWHDLRHTWASWLAQDGTPMHILREMGGWACYEHVMRYAHLSPDRFGEHASVVDRLLCGTNATHAVL